jgi:hypothetical protein
MSEKKGQALNILLDKSQFGALIYALHDLVKVLAAAQIKTDSDTSRNAHFLRAFGLSETEIGDILGMTQQAVNQALKKTKKTPKKVSRKKSSKTAIATVKET